MMSSNFCPHLIFKFGDLNLWWLELVVGAVLCITHHTYDWTLPFELMCDASNFTIGAVLAQRNGMNSISPAYIPTWWGKYSSYFFFSLYLEYIEDNAWIKCGGVGRKFIFPPFLILFSICFVFFFSNFLFFFFFYFFFLFFFWKKN